jgi:hypothetical protein
MSYCIARITPEGVTAIRHFPTYSEADEWLDHYAEIYDQSIVDIFPSTAIANDPSNTELDKIHADVEAGKPVSLSGLSKALNN